MKRILFPSRIRSSMKNWQTYTSTEPGTGIPLPANNGSVLYRNRNLRGRQARSNPHFSPTATSKDLRRRSLSGTGSVSLRWWYPCPMKIFAEVVPSLKRPFSTPHPALCEFSDCRPPLSACNQLHTQLVFIFGLVRSSLLYGFQWKMFIREKYGPFIYPKRITCEHHGGWASHHHRFWALPPLLFFTAIFRISLFSLQLHQTARCLWTPNFIIISLRTSFDFLSNKKLGHVTNAWL